MPARKTKKAEEDTSTESSSAAPNSSEKESFAALIETYKKLNPAKYAQKRVALEKKLASL